MGARRAAVLVSALALLAGCGGGDDATAGGGGGSGGGGGGGTTPLPNHTVTAADTSENTARLADLNAFRDACDGTALPGVSAHNALIISAVRHAGWQAIDDASRAGLHLNHGEPRSNALYSDNDLGERVRKANGGTHLSPIFYYEDIASRAGAAAITQLWNSVYHRVPMMRHRAWRMGFGDMALARADYPTAGVPADDEWGNTPDGTGYATLNWHQQTTPTIALSYWPGQGATDVPRTFSSDTESPDPVPGRNQVGCPIHIIFPETTGTFTAVDITLVNAGLTHIPLRVLVGNAAPSGAAGDVVSLQQDTFLDAGELFAIPLPLPTNTGLAPGTYTYSATVTINGTTYTLTNISYATAP